MKKYIVLLTALAAMGLPACGQYEPETGVTESTVTESVTETETEPETVSETEPETEKYEDTDKPKLPDDVPELPENIVSMLEGQLEAIREQDFEKWAENTDYDALIDMLLDSQEDADAQDIYWVMVQTADSFQAMSGGLPEEFAGIDSFSSRIGDITYTGTPYPESDYPWDSYTAEITGTELLCRFGVYRYSSGVPMVFGVTYDEPVQFEEAARTASTVLWAVGTLYDEIADIGEFPGQVIDCSDPEAELILDSAGNTSEGLGRALAEYMEETSGEAYVGTADIYGNGVVQLFVQWRSDSEAKIIGQYPEPGTRGYDKVWGEFTSGSRE